MVETVTLGGDRRGFALGADTAQGRRQGDSDRSPGRQDATVPVTVLGLNTPVHVDFAHDVAPVLSRLGCNAGTCHGSAQGKNGFKLSLRGYDPIFDVRALDRRPGRRGISTWRRPTTA